MTHQKTQSYVQFGTSLLHIRRTWVGDPGRLFGTWGIMRGVAITAEKGGHGLR